MLHGDKGFSSVTYMKISSGFWEFGEPLLATCTLSQRSAITVSHSSKPLLLQGTSCGMTCKVLQIDIKVLVSRDSEIWEVIQTTNAYPWLRVSHTAVSVGLTQLSCITQSCTVGKQTPC